MYLLDQVKYLRESILDDVGGTSVVWQKITESDAEASQLRWTNEELSFFLTQAEREIARRTKVLKDTSGNYDITTVVNQMDYPLDQKILRVFHAEADGQLLRDLEIEELINQYHWRDRKGKPSRIITDFGARKVTLWPVPDAIYTINLIVDRLPLKDLNWEDAEAQSPEIPEMHHFPMINYAAYLAYMKDEANALDPTRAASYKALFDADYPDQSWNSEIRKMRNRNRTVRYGGL